MTGSAHVNLLTDVLAPRYELPEGYDSWGIKSVRPDLTTRNNFRWPWPGNETDRFELDDHDDPCPCREGDGLCVALTWAGMAAGGFSARTLLLVAYRAGEARGDSEKRRVPQAFIVDVIDGEQLLNRNGPRAYLSCAYLTGAHLSGAYLTGAYLSRAYLSRANLSGAYLSGAYLSGAYLSGAYLSGANLSGANLYGADLTGAYLTGADLTGADLSGADLSRADLTGADLTGAYLSGHNIDNLVERGAIL